MYTFVLSWGLNSVMKLKVKDQGPFLLCTSLHIWNKSVSHLTLCRQLWIMNSLCNKPDNVEPGKMQLGGLQGGMLFHQVITVIKHCSFFPCPWNAGFMTSFIKLDWDEICLPGGCIILITYQSWLLLCVYRSHKSRQANYSRVIVHLE